MFIIYGYFKAIDTSYRPVCFYTIGMSPTTHSSTSAQLPPSPSLLEEYSPLKKPQDYQFQSRTTPHSPSQPSLEDDHPVKVPQDYLHPTPSPSALPSPAHSHPADCDSQKPLQGNLDRMPSPLTPSAAAQLAMADQDPLPSPQTPHAPAQFPMTVQQTPKRRYLTRSRGEVPPFAKRICKGTDIY